MSIFSSSVNLISALLLKKRRWLRVIYYGAVTFIIGFLLLAMIGIYGSLTGSKGPFWRISEICGYIAVVLLIVATIIRSAAGRGTRYDPEPSDIIVSPVYKDYDINIFHKN